jgi:hypothetical protein
MLSPLLKKFSGKFEGESGGEVCEADRSDQCDRAAGGLRVSKGPNARRKR